MKSQTTKNGQSNFETEYHQRTNYMILRFTAKITATEAFGESSDFQCNRTGN